MRKKKILVVDDNPVILRLLRANLEKNNFEVILAQDGEEALNIMEKILPDLLVLDLMMPRVDGIEVCRRIREWSDIPIIVLTVRGAISDKVTLLEMGADDYLVKPFSIEELLARIKAVLRRKGEAGIQEPPFFETGKVRIDFAARRVTVGGIPVRLTSTEYSILRELALNAEKVLTHEMLLSRVWGPECQHQREYLRVYIHLLRRKLGDDSQNPRYILTEPGVGYFLRKLPPEP